MGLLLLILSGLLLFSMWLKHERFMDAGPVWWGAFGLVVVVVLVLRWFFAALDKNPAAVALVMVAVAGVVILVRRKE